MADAEGILEARGVDEMPQIKKNNNGNLVDFVILCADTGTLIIILNLR